MGVYSADLTFWGDDNYNVKTVTVPFCVFVDSTINSNSLTRGFNSSYDFKAQFSDEWGNLLNNTNVSFKIAGREYNAMCDNDGVATIKLALGVGIYDVTSINPVSGESAVDSLNIVKRLAENKDINMFYDDGTVYKVRIVGDNGAFVGSGELVTITLNGKVYPVKTDSKGYAGVVVGLVPKDKAYSVSVMYKGDVVSNKVLVKSHFIGKNKVVVKRSIVNKRGYLSIKYDMGKYFAGKSVKLKFPGKTFNVKVDKKGKIMFKVSKKLVNKLKVGKKYAYTLIYKLDKKSRHITVYKDKLLFTS